MPSWIGYALCSLFGLKCDHRSMALICSGRFSNWYLQHGARRLRVVADQNRVWPILTYQRASTQHQIENSTQLTVKTITGIPSSFNKIIMGINVKYSVLLFKNYRFIVFDFRNDTTKILEHKRKPIVFTAFFNACIIRQAKPIKIYQWVISDCSDSRTSK